MKPLVLISPNKTNLAPDISDTLKKYADVEYVSRSYEDKLKGATVILASTEPIGAQYLDKASNLKLVARFGVGYDSVDVAECTRRRIYVTHTPEVLSGGVADHTWALILGFNRHIPAAAEFTKTRWGKREGYIPLGWDVEGRILGILGLGRIGTEVLKRAQGFPVKVIYYDIRRREDLEKEYGVEFVSFDELLKRSDILTIHVSLQESSRGMINAEALSKMKPTALLVNTSRGPVIVENDLIKVLQKKKIRGAALDVFLQEPTQLDNPLLKLDNVLLTPHCATSTWETRRKMAERSVGDVKAFLEGKRPPHLVPEQNAFHF